MAVKYNIFFVPEDRKEISALRRKTCKQVHSTQALQYPVHMSLISGGFEVKNYSLFEKALKELCSKQKPLELSVEENTAILPEKFWTGIMIKRTEEITEFQKKLQKLRNKYAVSKQTHEFRPLHITLAYPAKVDMLKEVKSPIKRINLDKIVIARKENEGRYSIYKKIKLER